MGRTAHCEPALRRGPLVPRPMPRIRQRRVGSEPKEKFLEGQLQAVAPYRSSEAARRWIPTAGNSARRACNKYELVGPHLNQSLAKATNNREPFPGDGAGTRDGKNWGPCTTKWALSAIWLGDCRLGRCALGEKVCERT